MFEKEITHTTQQNETEQTEFKTSYNKSVIKIFATFSETKNDEVIDGMDNGYIVEKYGFGIKKNYLICRDYKIVPPEINILESGFEVVLYKKKTDQKTDEEKILALIELNNKINIKEIALYINKGLTTTKTKLKKLKEQNTIKRIGPNKGVYWQIIKK